MSHFLLMPGMDGTARLFDAFEDAMPPEWTSERVVYPTNRAATLQQHVEVAGAALDSTEACFIVAESFSGPIALMLATRDRSSRIRGIVLVASFVSPPMAFWIRKFARAGAGAAAQVPPPRFAIRRWLVGPTASSAVVDNVRSSIASVQPSALASRARILAEVDARQHLEHVRLPVLALEAAHDRVVPGWARREFAEQRGVEHVVIEGPHLLLQTRPAACVGAIRPFVERIEDSRLR